MKIFKEVMPRLKEGTRDIEDILNEVAMEEGYTKQDVREVFNIHKKYIKHIMEKEDSYKIRLPYFGFLYYSTNMAKRYYKTDFFTNKNKTLRKLRKIHSEKYTAFYKYLNFKKSSIKVMYDNICKMLGKEITKTSTKEKREIIEKFSNNEL